MKEHLNKLLVEHWRIANNKIRDIETGLIENSWIKNQSYYLNPIVKEGINLSLNNERGEFRYYVRIKNTLGLLLAGQKPKYTYHFNGAPEEIKELLDKS